MDKYTDDIDDEVTRILETIVEENADYAYVTRSGNLDRVEYHGAGMWTVHADNFYSLNDARVMSLDVECDLLSMLQKKLGEDESEGLGVRRYVWFDGRRAEISIELVDEDDEDDDDVDDAEDDDDVDEAADPQATRRTQMHDEYTDDAWLDNLAAQYRIARNARNELLDVLADDLAKRLDEEFDDVRDALINLDVWFDRRSLFPSQASSRLLEAIQALMENESLHVANNLKALRTVAESRVVALAKYERGPNTIGLSESAVSHARARLETYLDDCCDGVFSGSFSAWLRKDVAAE